MHLKSRLTCSCRGTVRDSWQIFRREELRREEMIRESPKPKSGKRSVSFCVMSASSWCVSSFFFFLSFFKAASSKIPPFPPLSLGQNNFSSSYTLRSLEHTHFSKNPSGTHLLFSSSRLFFSPFVAASLYPASPPLTGLTHRHTHPHQPSSPFLFRLTSPHFFSPLAL